MPEWLIAVAGVAGIFLIGLIFSAVDLIKDIAKTVFISLFVFLVILLANRYLTPSATEQSYNNSYPPDSGFIEPLPSSSPGNGSFGSDSFGNGSFGNGSSSPAPYAPGTYGSGTPDSGTYAPAPYGSGYPNANDSQAAPPDAGNDMGSRSSDYFNNLVQDLREFVFGSPRYGSSSQPGTAPPQPETAPERDLIYVLPPDSYSQDSNQGSIASQPPSQPSSQPSNPSFNQPATTAPSQSFQPPAAEQPARSSAGTSTTRPVPAMW